MDNVTLARATMGTSLGFHIVFAVLGVGLPLLMLVAEGLWLRTRDEVWLNLARRWSKALGILFAVGAVSGTTLSFELGLLWPRFMAFSGAIFELPFSAEGFAFFIEAIFLGLYLYGWNRLTPVAHWFTFGQRWPSPGCGPVGGRAQRVHAHRRPAHVGLGVRRDRLSGRRSLCGRAAAGSRRRAAPARPDAWNGDGSRGDCARRHHGRQQRALHLSSAAREICIDGRHLPHGARCSRQSRRHSGRLRAAGRGLDRDSK